MAQIAFYKSWGSRWYNKLYALAVKTWTRGPYIHVELISDEEGACPKKWCWYSASAFTEGIVRMKSVDIKDGHWDIYELPRTFKPYESFEFMKSQLGMKYDWFGIFFSQTFKWGRRKKNKWFCSEIVRAALCKGDLFYCKNTGATSRLLCNEACQFAYNCDNKSAICDDRHHKYSPNKLFRELKARELI